MKAKYIIPEIYANETDRINAYKKILYKEKPQAVQLTEGKTSWRYCAETSLGIIFFEIPVKEMGELPFNQFEQAQLLIRWIKL